MKSLNQFLGFILVISVLSAACSTEQSTVTAITQSPEDIAIPSTLESTPSEERETPVSTIIPQAAPPPVLERPGFKVVYTRDGNLRLWSPEGKRQLTSSGDAYFPKISPDGQIVAFLRPVDDYHQELWAVDTDGKNERKLLSIADLDAIGGGVRDPDSVGIIPYHYEWIPGSHTLAFNTQQVFQGPGLSLLDDLHLVDADGLQIKYLLLSGWGGEFAYSPDGNQIAIINPTSINLCYADGSNYRIVLTYDAVNTYSEYRFYAAPVWSPNGDFLRIAIPPEDPLAEPRLPTELWTIPVDGAELSQDGSVLAVPFFERPVVFSPDLSRIIYLREVGEPAENLRQLHFAAYDGTGDVSYAEGSLLHFLNWSIDSYRFSFSVGEDQEAWIGNLDAPPVIFPYDALGIVEIRWVDSRNYLYFRQRSEGFKFYLANLEGGETLLDSFPGPPPAYDFAYP